MATNPYLMNRVQNANTNSDTPTTSNKGAFNPYLKKTGITTNQTTTTTGNTATPNTVPQRAVQQPTSNTPQPQKKSNAYQQQYKNQAVMTMTQGEMLLKLYDEIIKQLNIAINSIDDQEDSAQDDGTTQLKELTIAARRVALNDLVLAIRGQLTKETEDTDADQNRVVDKVIDGFVKQLMKQFKNVKDITDDDIKEVITEQAVEDLVKKRGVTINNNGGKAKNAENNALAEKRHLAISKTVKIFDHLIMTLNFDFDISNNLRDLYLFFKRSVHDANTKNVSKPLKDILPLVQDLRDAYAEAEQNVKTGKGQIGSN